MIKENELGVNPFMKAFIQKSGKKKGTPSTRDYVRVYRGNEASNLVYSISKAASFKVLNYVFQHISYGSKAIMLDMAKVTKEIGIGKASFYQAVKELAKLGVIGATTKVKHYWVNPSIVFYGSRIKAYPDNYYVRGKHS